MKRPALLSLFVLLFLLGGLGADITAARGPAVASGRVAPAVPSLAQKSRPARHAAVPHQAMWHLGPFPPPDFQYVRHDATFVPGPRGASWANRIYFLGGRTSPSTESPNIWVFDPATGIYTDTQADMVEDVSNYNSNLILDDCTGRGPAIYVIGGTDKDHGGANIGLVQRYYPKYNLVESLPSADNWPSEVGGVLVAAMGTAVVNDRIYAYGGWETNVSPYFSAETWLFDPCAPSGSRWTNLNQPMHTARSYIMSAVQGGKVYAMGGVSSYVGGELDPTDQVEMLDTAHLEAGWQVLAPMPVAIDEGRGYGFDSDTLAPLPGYIYTAGGGDWPMPSAEAMAYDVAANSWDQSFPDLNEVKANNAGTYVPLYTPDPNDGLPGLWTFGGRINESCDPPMGQTEYYPLDIRQECSILLVDDDWDQYEGEPYNGTGTFYYTSTLEHLGYAYDRWDTWSQGEPTAADMQGYDAVVWFTGYAWTGTVTVTTEAALAAYLDGGGSLFLSSEDYLYERGLSPFAMRYLGIDSFIGDTAQIDPIGNAGDPIGDGLGPYTLTVPTSWPADELQLWTDEITPSLGGGAPFRYRGSGTQSGTDIDTPAWQTVFLAWPLEGLADLQDRADVLGWILFWFCTDAHQPELLLLPPAQAGSAVVGGAITYTISLANHLGFDDTFDLQYAAAWPVSGPVAIGPVPNGAVHEFEVLVSIPPEADCGADDLLWITARSSSYPTVYSDRATVATMAEPPGEGLLDGTVYDQNTGLGIPGAHVSVQRGVFYTETWTDAAGAYLFALQACHYTGEADAARYTGEPFAVGLVPAMTTTQNLYLRAGWPDLAPRSVAVTLTAGQSAAFTLTLANTGTVDLNLAVGVVPSDALWLTVGPYGAIVGPGMSEAIPLTLDTAGLPPAACYTATLAFTYDDPYIWAEEVPVALCVEQGCEAVVEVDFARTPLTPTVGETGTFTAAVSGTPTPPVFYTWDFADGAIVVTTATVVTHAFTATGSYSVTLAAANACGQARAVRLVTVSEPPQQRGRIYLPIVQKNG